MAVLLVEEAASHKLYHIMLFQVHLAWAGFEPSTLVVIGTDCIGSYKSNYHLIRTTTGPYYKTKAILNPTTCYMKYIQHKSNIHDDY